MEKSEFYLNSKSEKFSAALESLGDPTDYRISKFKFTKFYLITSADF